MCEDGGALHSATRRLFARAMDAKGAKRRERAHKQRARDREARDATTRDATRGRKRTFETIRDAFGNSANDCCGDAGATTAIDGARRARRARLTRANDSRANAQSDAHLARLDAILGRLRRAQPTLAATFDAAALSKQIQRLLAAEDKVLGSGAMRGDVDVGARTRERRCVQGAARIVARRDAARGAVRGAADVRGVATGGEAGEGRER